MSGGAPVREAPPQCFLLNASINGMFACLDALYTVEATVYQLP